MIRAIFLKKKRKNVTKEWLEILPELARHLEIRLYKNAPNMKEYSNLSTLPDRLIDIYNEVNDITMTRMLGDVKITTEAA